MLLFHNVLTEHTIFKNWIFVIAAEWSSFFKLNLDNYEEDIADVYDCRLRPWYVAAGGAPRDILVLFDATGSMYNSTNKVNAEQFTQTLLNALTDDDQVNVLRFNEKVKVESPITCFNDKLVSVSMRLRLSILLHSF